MANALIQGFKERFEALSGHVHLVDSPRAAASTVLDILRERGTKHLAVAGLPEDLADVVVKVVGDAGIGVDREPFAALALPDAIGRADAGVTGAAFAVAQSGTLAEVSKNDAVRLVSSLPRTHIAMVRAADIVDRFEDAAPHLRSLFEQHDCACVVSFISGPSRTGDIELKLTLGVHGPEDAHAIIIES